jgi:hypothetical protein
LGEAVIRRFRAPAATVEVGFGALRFANAPYNAAQTVGDQATPQSAILARHGGLRSANAPYDKAWRHDMGES